MCGCSATAGNIFGGHKVDERVNVSEAKGPETAYAYKGKTSFGKWNPDTILPLFFGEETVEEQPSNRSVRYTASDGSYLHLNLHRSGAVAHDNIYSITYSRADYYKYRNFTSPFYAEPFKKEQGNFGSVLGEAAADDPMMIFAKDHSGQIMDELDYSRYELLRANKFSEEDVREMALLFGINKASMIPDKAYYQIAYRFYPASMAEDHHNGWMECHFIYDADGLCFAYIQPEPKTEQTESGKAISAKKAYKVALESFDGDDELVLFDVQFVVAETKDQYRPVWAFYFAQESENRKNAEQVKDAGAKGWYTMKIQYVDALTGESLPRNKILQPPVYQAAEPMINKYNNPKLFK
jgi:hypothetical protein